MKNTPKDDRLALTRILARFGGRFLCRSPPAEGGGPPPRRRTAQGAGPVHGGAVASGRWTKKPRLRRAVRYVLAILFCMIVAVIVLTDPFCATVLAAGRRLRRPRAEKAAITLVATSTEKEHAP